MLRFAVLIAFAGCGRRGFEATSDSALTLGDTTTDDVLLGHDEDGDGVPDTVDTCPHIVAPQDDGDGDGVGDACDPRPTLGGEVIMRFDPMTGTQPFTVGTFTSGTFSQRPDAVRFDASQGMPPDLYGGLGLPLVVGSVRVAMGIDIVSVIAGQSMQNQIALAVHDGPPNYFIELNQIPGNFDVASVTFYDGTNFSQADGRDLATGIHPGPLFFQTTQVVNTGVTLDVGWPGEMYTAQVTDTLYQGATQLEINLNNVELEFRYLLVITSP